MSSQFEAIASKYWQLLHQSGKTANKKFSNGTNTQSLTKDQYCGLLKRIYKVLAPLYREPEVESEVN